MRGCQEQVAGVAGMKLGPFVHDPRATFPQYLEDLATAYWYSELLFTAVEVGIFTILAEGGLTASELASRLGIDRLAAKRFLRAGWAQVHHPARGFGEHFFVVDLLSSMTENLAAGCNVAYHRKVEGFKQTHLRCGPACKGYEL